MINDASTDRVSGTAEPSVPADARLTLSLLGSPSVLLSGRRVVGPRAENTLALLAYLAMESHRPHRRGVLATLFWPDRPRDQALQDLRQALSRLRRAIADQEADPWHLLVDAATIRFNRESHYWLDVEAFQALVSDTQRHAHRRLDVCLSCMARLAQAVEYYQGDLLEDLHVADSPALDEWLLIQREQLRQKACASLKALASSNLASDQPKEACGYARRLLQMDPWNEPGQRLLLSALRTSEGRNAALQHYETFRQTLGQELGVEPEDETRHLAKEIRSGALVDMEARTQATALPTPLTPIAGREAERKDISDDLAERRHRLLVLHGPGGIGKTRLALEVAAEQATLWRDGVWFVSLAEIPASEGLSAAISGVLHREAAPLDAPQLIAFLRSKELLLILDEFEHLLTGVPLLAEILCWAPEVKILVTSRARLGVKGERAIPLAGLKVPAKDPAIIAETKGYSAVQLFLQSARRAAPGFGLSPENLPHVLRICRLVAGLPLGIELAAAWVHLFSCRKIADEIEHSAGFLRNPRSSNPTRHDSLRASFEHSYRLLPAADRSLYRRLTVFRGGFTPEAAGRVAGADPSALSSLLYVSLLQTSSRRLDMHLALREFAAERLADEPREEWETRERHSRTYLAMVRERGNLLRGTRAREASDEIDLELANVGAAWRWAVEQVRLEELESSIGGLARFYDLRGLFREAEDLFGSAAERVLALDRRDQVARRVACRLRVEQAHFSECQAKYAEACQVAGQAVELARETQEPLCEARAASIRGEALWRQGDLEAARRQLDHALSLVRATVAVGEEATATAREVEARSLNTLGIVCWMEGDWTSAKGCLRRALDIAAQSGDRRRQALVLGNMGVTAVEQGDYAEARDLLQQALQSHRLLGHRGGESRALGNLGNVYLYLGAYAKAKTHYEDALRMQREIGARKDECLSVGNLSLVCHYLGDNENAKAYSQQALMIADEIGERRAQGAMWMKVGHALAELGQLDEAARAYRKSVGLRREMGSLDIVMEPLAGLASVALAQGNLPEARVHVDEILSHLKTGTLHGAIDPLRIYMTCYLVLSAQKDPRARRVLHEAYVALRGRAARIGDTKLRRSFLHAVASHRELIHECAQVSDAEE